MIRQLSKTLAVAVLFSCPLVASAQTVRTVSTQPVVQQQSWGQQMFSDLSFDFGYVAKNSDVRRQVVITNKFKDDITISSVNTSCRCGQPSLLDPKDPSKTVSQFTLKSWETGILNIKIDTVAHSGHRHPTISVLCQFRDKNGAQHSETVRIPLNVEIRSDLQVTPGSADFGVVDLGAPAERHVSVVNSSYSAGQWQVREVRSNNKSVAATAREVRRANGRIEYDLAVTLAGDVPAGEFREQLTVVTNDPSNPNIPVLVRATVVPEFQIIPSVVQLGALKPGVDKTVTVVVKAKKPFAIEKVEADKMGEGVQVKVGPEAKALHVLPVKITPSGAEGNVNMNFTLTIAGRETPITFTAQGTVEKTVNSSTAAK